MSELYIDIMLQSLEKKEVVLDRIIEANVRQEAVLKNPEGDPEEFDETVETKGVLIEQLEQLDSGFQKLFDNMKEELDGQRENYAKQIEQMQIHIRSITDKSVQIQAQEARNKELMTQKFARIKEMAKQTRASSNMVNRYYKNMSKLNVVDPQFLDDKN